MKPVFDVKAQGHPFASVFFAVQFSGCKSHTETIIAERTITKCESRCGCFIVLMKNEIKRGRHRCIIQSNVF
ncbi:hypothetical protein BJH90_10920 [Bacillus halotolerans]|nr:hypothetical protein BJH90_10920 [Bacillus halotolerans]